MEYLVEGRKYNLSYSELREDGHKYRSMRDEEFIQNIIPALHFACVVCYLKEIPSSAVLSDEGIIHQLVHLIDPNTREHLMYKLRDIRELFDTVCKLA